MELTPSHKVTPVLGSVRRVRDGEPADLMDRSDYPVEAIDQECGEIVRCERMYLCEWEHTGRKPGDPAN